MRPAHALTPILAFVLTLVLVAPAAGADADKLDTPLRFLRSLRTSGLAQARAGDLARVTADERVTVTVKFDHVLTDIEIADIERLGAAFFRVDGEVARTAAIYTLRVPWSALDGIADRPEVARVASAWRPAVHPLLDVSAHEIQADSVWRRADDLGLPLTGKGMRISDFDTGIDVFHPSFFYADGDTLDWVDEDLSGSWDPGEAVDLNGNGVADAGEAMRYWDGPIVDYAQVWGTSNPANLGNGYQTYWDWLYNDEDDSGTREFGPDAGYAESTPGFGEPIFIALDNDDDGQLDAGEKVVRLGTSKVYATLGANAVERVRGTDIILSDDDTNGHGSSVAGILAGGTVDRHRFTGIAPDAEVLMGYFFSDNPISSLIPWARSRGADVMLYEFGGFVWDFLDGSSVDEEAITTENATILQVTPSGNLARGHKHAVATAAAGDSVVLPIGASAYAGTALSSIWQTSLWRTSQSDLVFRLESPLGGRVTLQDGVWSVDGYELWFERATSDRGTCALNLWIGRGTNADVHGTWQLHVVNVSAADVETIDNVTDDVTSWAYGAEFLAYYTDDRTVTWPATADDAFVNGSYSTRGFEGYTGVGGGSVPAGEISVFSGRGTRFDGQHLLDICSPGNYDVYSTRSHAEGTGFPIGAYRQFSGTSAAGPHVAAAVALIAQAFPALSMSEVAERLTSHAGTDSFTGTVYNDTWGWGKLRILDALGYPVGVEEPVTGTAPALQIGQNQPNPFGSSTWIPFAIRESGPVSLNIYDVRGRLVRTLRARWMPGGAHGVHWSGDDAAGRRVAPGLYFCVLRSGGLQQSRKIALLR